MIEYLMYGLAATCVCYAAVREYKKIRGDAYPVCSLFGLIRVLLAASIGLLISAITIVLVMIGFHLSNLWWYITEAQRTAVGGPTGAQSSTAGSQEDK